jgi:hypothetical protein
VEREHDLSNDPYPMMRIMLTDVRKKSGRPEAGADYNKAAASLVPDELWLGESGSAL